MGLGFTAVKMGSRVLVLNHGTELLLQAEGKKKTLLLSTAASQEKLAMVEFHSLALFLLGSE